MECTSQITLDLNAVFCVFIVLLILLSLPVALLLLRLRSLSLALEARVLADPVTESDRSSHAPPHAVPDGGRDVGAPTISSATRGAEDSGKVTHASSTGQVNGGVPLDVFDGIIQYCLPEDLCRLALACPGLGSLIRARRLRRIVITEETYFDFREWLYQVAMVQLITGSALQTPVPGLNITVPISPSLRDQFNRHLRELVFPEHWSPGSASFVKVIAALRPSGVETVVFGSTRTNAGWYRDLVANWEPTTMDSLLAAVKTLVFVAPTRGGLRFVLMRRPATSSPFLYQSIETIKIQSAIQGPSGWDADDGSWSTLGFGAPVSAAADGDLAVVARVMHLSLLKGIRSDLARLAFPHLQHLHIVFEDWCHPELELVDRLVSEAATSLTSLKFTLNRSSAPDDGLLRPRETLSSLSTVTVDWGALSFLGLLESTTLPNRVEIVVDKYVGNLASDAQYAQAAKVLKSTHWAKVAFVDIPGRDMLHHEDLLEQRRAYLQKAIGVFDMVFI